MRRPLRVLCAVLAAALLSPAVPASAAPPPATPPELALPAPTGPHPVGSGTLHLRDETRPDPWVPSGPRELMLTAWYPATEPAGTPARYLSPEESRLFVRLQEAHGAPPIADDALLSRVRTHSTTAAPALRTAGGHPLVVLSPGFSWPRATLTGMAEDLASRGYVVAAIGHNYESAGTEFPDGRVTPCAACSAQDMAKVVRTRAADVPFALDELLGDPRFGPLIDRDRIGLIGHSIGGASAPGALLADPRIDAAANLDGTFPLPLPDRGVDAPFLLLGSGPHAPEGIDPSWDRAWERLRGWKRWITLNGSGHGSMTDLSLLMDQAGIRYPGEPLPGARGAELGNRYVAAFLDLHLRGRAQPILDGPGKGNPEALFWHRPLR